MNIQLITTPKKAWIQTGVWPDIFKCKIVTPVPRVFRPLVISDLRNISGLLTMNKLAEKFNDELMFIDMMAYLDPNQYANQKGNNIHHSKLKHLY